MKLIRVGISIALAALAFLAVGCAPPYRQKFWDEGDQRGWTEKQKLAAFAYYDKIGWAREVKEGQYVIIYGRVPTSKVREQLDTILIDFNEALDPKNEEMRKYIDTFGLRKDLEHDEVVAEAVEIRVKAAELETDFKQEMGEAPSYGPDAEYAQGYNIRKIFLAKDLSTAFPFKSEVIEAAKKNGILKPIETLSLDMSSTLDHKEADPANLDDKNEFVWKAKTRSVKLTNYKIIDSTKPVDNQGNYIEGYRVENGKQEDLPCLKVFFPGGGSSALVLVDVHREGDAGWGTPDLLVHMSVSNLQTIVRDDTLLNAIFIEKKEEARKVPETKLFKIEISRIGEPASPWEESKDPSGWVVPFKYVTTRGENYNVRIKFKKPKVDPNDPNSIEHAHSPYMDVEYIAKEYTKSGERYEASPGAVIEYYRPKAQFATGVLAQVVYEDDTKKVSFVYPDGTEVVGFVVPGDSKFIESKPYAISYTEGQKRFWIEKSTGSQVFDKRKQVSPPKETTGEYYEVSGPELGMENRAATPGPSEEDRKKAVPEWGGPDGGHFDFPDTCKGEVNGTPAPHPCKKP
jgi:hypothetical protein